MNKLLFLLGLIGILAIDTGSPSIRQFEHIEQQIKQEIQKGAIPSLAVAVAREGEVIFKKAYGWADLENKIKATATTSYQLASVSKPITATGLMVLHERQRVNLDNPAEHYMGPLKFKSQSGNSSDVKVKHLLNHTSGLGTYFDIVYADENRGLRDFEDSFKTYGILVHPPGTICEYSNLGYGLIDRMISRISGKSFPEFMEQEVFKPLGMKNSFVEKSNRTDLSIAQKYDSNLRLLPAMHNDTSGAGNIYASIHDLIQFGMFNLKNEVPGQMPILSSDTIDLMHSHKNENTLYPYYESAYYGYGWYFRESDQGYKNIWHEGGAMGMSSIIELIPSENIVVAVLTNTSNNLICQNVAHTIIMHLVPGYTPFEHNEIAQFRPVSADPSYLGIWRGKVHVEELTIPISFHFQADGDVVAQYTDHTFKSYFTQNNPIPHKAVLLSAIVNKDYFLGMFPGILPAEDIRREFSHFMSLKLLKEGDKLCGTVVAMAAAEREYYAYPFYLELEKQK